MNTLLRPAALIGLVVLAGVAQAATPLSASMSLGARSEVSGTIVLDVSTDAWGALLSNLAIGATALAVDPADATRTVLTQGFGNAGWSSANAGAVSFAGYGWEISAAAAASVSASLTNAQPDWNYSFTAGAGDVQFKVDYDVFGSGSTFGLWGWSIFVDGGPEGSQSLPVSNPADPTASGTFLASLTPGQTYTVRLETNANLGNQVQGFDASGQMSGTFRWEISPIPEPGTWALMVLGLAAVAAAARRRRV